jgi:hypothetical protein
VAIARVRLDHRVDAVVQAFQGCRFAVGHRERLHIPFRDPVIGTDIGDHGTPILPAGEEIRRMSAGTSALVLPAKPERLRRDRPHRGVKVHEHKVIPLQPGPDPTWDAVVAKYHQPAKL